jgi:prepilin-type N-terminal cleavage/methylation domain-containing protein
MKRSGFTLVELLIVMAVVATLVGMAFPLLTMAQDKSKRSATLATMGKVDTALRLFKQELLVFPYQRTYPADGINGWSNRLAYHLGTDIDPADAAKVKADMATAAAQYDYPIMNRREPAPTSVHMFRANRLDGATITDITGKVFPMGDVMPLRWELNAGVYRPVYPRNTGSDGRLTLQPAAALLNHLAAERARLLILSGNIDAVGLRVPDSRSPNLASVHTGRDCSGSRLVPSASAVSGGQPGWAVDYLGESVAARSIDPGTGAILDGWNRPLIYIGQVLHGVRGSMMRFDMFSSNDLKTVEYGMDTRGRVRLDSALPADPPRLPDPANLLHSDLTAYAAPGQEHEFELWSGGRDGRFSAMRDDPMNRDNVSYQRYDRSLAP